MRYVPFLLIAMGIGLGAGPLRADTVPSRQYTTQDGLPSKQITALAQTNSGLLWIGTHDGLVVYDGHEFRPIPMPDSVAQNTVFALTPMPDGSVWAGVGDNAVRVAPHGVVESHLLDSHNVVKILRRGGRVRFVTHLAVWEQRAGRDTLSRTPFRYEGLEGVTQVWGADLGPDGTLWIVNGRRGPGRVLADGTVDFADPPPPPPTEKSRGEQFDDLRFSPDGTALVARAAHLYRFDPDTETFTVLADTLAPSNEIHRQGRTAYLTGQSEVLRYDTRARSFKPSIGAFRDRPTMTTVALRGRDGGLWVGTQRAGLLHVPDPEVRHVTAIDGDTPQYGMGLERRGPALWGNTWGDGLFQLRPQRRHVAPRGHPSWVFLRSHDGRLHGLTPSDSARGRNWYRWTSTGGWRFVGIAKEAVRGYVDSSGVGYFWHNRGLYRHEPSGDTTRRTRLRSWPLEESQHHLIGPAPNGDIILFDQGLVLRLRRPDGAVIDTIAMVPEHAESGGRRLTVDAKGRIWIPFNSLLRIDPQTGRAQTLLEGANVENVQMAGDSLAMAKTDEGLYLLSAETGAVRRHLTEADGLLANDVNGAHLMDDTLCVGHPSGLTLMPTDSLFRASRSPHAVLTGLEVKLENRALPGDSLLGKSERTVGISYTGVSLTHPDRVRYEVRLAPSDTAWSRTERRFTRYTNLEPGSYRFEVRARLANGPPGPVAAYTFTIPPHFYETWWFRLLVAAAFIGLAVGAYRWRTVRLRRRQEQLETAVHKRTRQLQARTEELAEQKEKTERQAEELTELDEAKNRFFAHVSHEFRTPLSLILGPLCDALREQEGEVLSVGRRQVERMTTNAERLRRLIDQLLDLATLEAGRMELERQPGDLASVVERSTEAFRSKAEQKEIDLRIERPEGRIETRFDPEKVETIVSNLVGNAVKFTPVGGRVTVRIAADADTEAVETSGGDSVPRGTARIDVEDTGPGIDPGVQDQIFDRFEQADNSMTREHEGTGLGLALTGELVDLQGGTIDVDSAPGEGSMFTVRLPLVPVAAPVDGRRGDGARRRRNGRDGESAGAWESVGDGERFGKGEWERERGGKIAGDGEQVEAEPGETGAEDGATILVVEDDDQMRRYLREELSGRWHILEAADGEVGWRRAQEEQPDLVVSDVMMPELDGFELCRRIKVEEELRTIPVVLLTARADEDGTLEGLESGADDYVAKPFAPEELRRRIENHLTARRHVQNQCREEVTVEAVETVIEAEERPFVENLLDAVEEDLSNPDFGVGDLAEAMALSRRQLTRRVKKTLDVTPGDLIQRRRLERAREMLAADPGTVGEVAYAVGFRSPSHFSSRFREEVGRTPSTYAQQNGSTQQNGKTDRPG